MCKPLKKHGVHWWYRVSQVHYSLKLTKLNLSCGTKYPEPAESDRLLQEGSGCDKGKVFFFFKVFRANKNAQRNILYYNNMCIVCPKRCKQLIITSIWGPNCYNKVGLIQVSKMFLYSVALRFLFIEARGPNLFQHDNTPVHKEMLPDLTSVMYCTCC